MQSPNSLDAVGDSPSSAEHDPERIRPTSEIAAGPSAALRDPRAWLWAGAVLAFVVWLLLSRLGQYGIWDPWELETADAARARLEHADASPMHSLGLWLVSAGFRTFGVHEWAGRLPIALCAVLCALTAFEVARRYCDVRAGTYAALITATCPLLAFNARTMLGAAPDMAISGALGLCLLSAVLAPDAAEREPVWEPVAWLLAATALATLAVATRGALLAALPPLGAAVGAAWLAPPETRLKMRRASRFLVGLCCIAGVAMIARDIRRDASEHSMWLGGAASGVNPPTFDSVLEQVFHAFAPWSALLPIALSRIPFAAHTPHTPTGQGAARLALLQSCGLWVALSYGAQTLYVSRYGQGVTFLALVPLAVLVAVTLRDLEAEQTQGWGAALAVLLLMGLLLRDFVLFPSGMVQGVPLQTFEVPKDWNPRGAMAAICIPFGLCAALGFAAAPSLTQPLDLRAPYRFCAAQWRRGSAYKAWLIALGLVLVGLSALGVVAYLIPKQLHMPSLAIKIVRRLAFTPLALGALLAAGQLVLHAFARLKTLRFVPLLLAGAAFGAYAAQQYLPGLSEQFSPREIYTLYNELAARDAVLAEFRVGGRGAPYYAEGSVIEVTSVPQLVEHLTQNGQRWATFPKAELATIDHAYRKRSGKHMFVLEAQSERGLLATSEPIPGRPDRNTLAAAVQTATPASIQHPADVSFDDRIELVGYGLQLPHADHVAAGETLTLTWYFRCKQKLATPYRVFVHIDGEGQRIHGDHDPVESAYPVTLWEPGDVIVDQQKIEVPASSPPGEYQILMGFYSGDTRLPIRRGPNAGEDRATVGVLRIR